jgi:hypothetical protein
LGESTAGAQANAIIARQGKIKAESDILQKSEDLLIKQNAQNSWKSASRRSLGPFRGLVFSPDATKGQLILDEIASRPC